VKFCKDCYNIFTFWQHCDLFLAECFEKHQHKDVNDHRYDDGDNQRDHVACEHMAEGVDAEYHSRADHCGDQGLEHGVDKVGLDLGVTDQQIHADDENKGEGDQRTDCRAGDIELDHADKEVVGGDLDDHRNGAEDQRQVNLAEALEHAHDRGGRRNNDAGEAHDAENGRRDFRLKSAAVKQGNDRA